MQPEESVKVRRLNVQASMSILDINGEIPKETMGKITAAIKDI